MRVEWRWDARQSARRFLADQPGMRAVNAAVGALTQDPAPPEAFVRGRHGRLRVGAYRVLYEIEGDLITIVRVDRVLG